jgi:heterotetrameric sarcosine oxidase gamma subunit
MRRSPIRDRHASLGARWVAPATEWPETYGDVAAERQAIRTAVGLCDWGPADKLWLHGPTPTVATGAIGVVDIDGRPAQVWALADDESVLIAPARDGGTDALRASWTSANAYDAVDVSSHFVVLRLAGPRARDVLRELCPVDVSAAALADRRFSSAPLASVAVHIGRFDVLGVPSFTILAERDQGAYLWDTLRSIGAAHGLEPVGAAALVED